MPQLKASAGKIDLEPRVGGWMAGFASRVGPSEGLHDLITARAVLLDNGETSLAIVVCDLVGLSADTVAEIRREIPVDNVLISCTHTHSGPASLPMRGVLGYVDADWLAGAKRKIVDLVAGLASKLVPARIAHASTTVTGVGFNRQDNSRPHDEELVVIAVESESGEPIATLANYATHAVVLGGGYMLYSADFPGEVNRRVEQARGGVSLYLQGGCGDVNPSVELRGNFEDCERIGDMLAQAAVAAIADAPLTSDVTLAAASKVVDVPLDPPPTLEKLDERVARFEADKKAGAESGNRVHELVAVAMLDWASELRELIVRDTVPGSVAAEVFAAKINDLRLVSLPFETYNDIGVAIKRGIKPMSGYAAGTPVRGESGASVPVEVPAAYRPPLKGVFVGYANGCIGYCPTRWAKDQGGYGPEDSMYWFGALVTPIGYGGDELLIKEGIALARSL